MDTRQNQLNWLAMLWSATLLFIIPTGLTLLVSVGYGVVVGFQTRGDSEMIDQALIGLFQTSWYQALPFVLTVFVAIWRGVVLTKQAAGNLEVHIIIMAVAAQIMSFVTSVVVFQNDIGAILPTTAIELGLGIGCALGGAYLLGEHPTRALAETQS